MWTSVARRCERFARSNSSKLNSMPNIHTVGYDTSCFLAKSCCRMRTVSSASGWSALREAFHHRQTPLGGVYIIDERAARLDRRPAEHRLKRDTLLQHIEGPNACHYQGQQASSIKHPAVAQGNRYWRNLQPHLMTITLHYHVSSLNWRDYPLRVAGDCQWVVLGTTQKSATSPVIEPKTPKLNAGTLGHDYSKGRKDFYCKLKRPQDLRTATQTWQKIKHCQFSGQKTRCTRFCICLGKQSEGIRQRYLQQEGLSGLWADGRSRLPADIKNVLRETEKTKTWLP